MKLRIVAVLAMAVLLSACGMSMDTIRYAGTPDGPVQTAPCVVETVEEVAPVVQAAKATRIDVRQPIMFPFDSSEIVADEMAKIDKLANLLKEYPDTHVVINGFASSEGPEDYNLDLSGQRATAVKSALIEKGISEDRISTVAKGETGIFGDLLKLNRRAIVLDVD